MLGTHTRTMLTAAGFGAMTGMRSLAAPALISHELAHWGRSVRGGRAARFFSSRATSRALGLLAAGEIAADKSPWIPARVAPLPLIGRALLGALGGALVASHRGESGIAPALLGGIAAVAAAAAMHTVRRQARRTLPLPDAALGLLEDGLVVALGARLRGAIR